MIIWGGAFGKDSGGQYCACAGGGSLAYRDADGDGFGDNASVVQLCSLPPGYVSNGGDCNDVDANDWATPSEVRNLLFFDNKDLTWTIPESPGSTADAYDLIRSSNASDFVASAVCVAADTTDTSAADSAIPALGTAFFYLVRAQDDCPTAQGPAGTASDGTPRATRSCP
jgi:hypothetical protein